MCLLIPLSCSPKAELRRAQRDLSLALTCKFCPYMPFIQSSNKDVTNSEIKPPARWLTFPAHLLFGANWIDKIQCSKIWWWLNLPAAICNKRHKAPIKEGQRLNPRCRWITCENTCPKGACSKRQLSIITRGDPCTNIINVDALNALMRLQVFAITASITPATRIVTWAQPATSRPYFFRPYFFSGFKPVIYV